VGLRQLIGPIRDAFGWSAMFLRRVAVSLTLLAVGQPSAFADDLDFAIAQAVELDQAYPDVPDDTDIGAAYALQADVVESVYGTHIAGYKAGLTSVATQQRFGVDGPVLGVLPESGRLASVASLAWTPGLKIELEIGYLYGTDDQPAAMLPVVELPRLAYVDIKQVSLADIVATNVSAYRFMAGASRSPDPNVRSNEVSLLMGGNELFTATGVDALGDPRVAYAWMVKQIRALGYDLRPGMLLITGALGRVMDAQPGAYVAQFGALGELTFVIEGNSDALQAARQ
jgi:2-keto-4-pentenoate hydratase